jgi:GH35 family endo-1,4-beta-xylanase
MKINNAIPVLLFAIVLVSCAPAAEVVPTEVIVATSTFTPVPTATATITPTPAPENIADAKDLSRWVDEFVQAYGGKITVNGLEMDSSQLTDEIRRNGDNYLVKKQVNEVEILFLVVSGVPLAIRTSREWSATTLKELAGFNGMKIGMTISGGENAEVVNSQYSMVSIAPPVIEEDGDLSWYTNTARFTERNGLDLYGPHLFWNSQFDEHQSIAYLKNANAQTVEDWMRKRAYDIFKSGPGVDYINVSNEAVYTGPGIIWNNSPMYSTFGEEWLKKAWHIAYEEAQRAGVDVSKVHFIFNDYSTEWPGVKSDFYYHYILAFQDELKAEGITLDNPVSIGIEFHIRTDDTIQWGPLSSEITYDGLLAHFIHMGEVAPIDITELDVRKYTDPNNAWASRELIPSQEEARLFYIIVKAAVDSGKVQSIVFWDENVHATILNAQSEGTRYLPYFEVAKALFEGLK